MHIFTSKLRTLGRQAQIILGYDNEASVIIRHDEQPLDITQFSRFELSGIGGRTIDSLSDFGSIRPGAESGEVVLNLGNFLTEKGRFDTELVAFSSDFPNGVILWHPKIQRAKLVLTVSEL